MTTSEQRQMLDDLEKRYPNETVRRDYDGSGELLSEPEAEQELWPTCDAVLAQWYGGVAADYAEGFTIINWEGRA